MPKQKKKKMKITLDFKTVVYSIYSLLCELDYRQDVHADVEFWQCEEDDEDVEDVVSIIGRTKSIDSVTISASGPAIYQFVRAYTKTPLKNIWYLTLEWTTIDTDAARIVCDIFRENPKLVKVEFDYLSFDQEIFNMLVENISIRDNIRELCITNISIYNKSPFI